MANIDNFDILNFADFIDRIRDSTHITHDFPPISDAIFYQNFNGFDLSTLDIEKNKFWQLLLNYFSTENTQLKNPGDLTGHWYFRKKDITNSNQDQYKVLLQYITERINSSTEAQEVIAAIRSSTTPTQNDFWNESATTLIRYILANFDPTYDPNNEHKWDIIVDENNTFNIHEIENGDAGHSFESNEEWVLPWKNGQGQTYSQVRGNDKKLSALTNDQNINSTSNSGIKLLLPQYERHVEVEDLDRNFWVIGQSLAGISAFLFSSESPFTNTFESIIAEIIDLWENILYLWIAYALAMQDKTNYTDVHTEVVYLSMNDNYEIGYKRDNFSADPTELLAKDDSEMLTYLKQKLLYATAKYPHCHLCLIPVFRFDNYESENYSTEYYPGVILVDRNQETEMPVQEQGETAAHYNQRLLSYTLDSENLWTFKRFGHDNQGIISIQTDTSIYGNDAIYVNTQSALGFTYNNFNDFYFINLNNVTSGLKVSDVDSSDVFIGNTDFLSNLSVRDNGITYYTLVRSAYSNSNVAEYTDGHLIFNGFQIQLYDVSLGCRTSTNLIETINWIVNGNNISRTITQNSSYNPAAQASSYNTYTDTTKWPLYGYTSSELSGHNSIKMIAPIKLNVPPYQNLGFDMGELMTNKVNFFEEIEDIN